MLINAHFYSHRERVKTTPLRKPFFFISFTFTKSSQRDLWWLREPSLHQEGEREILFHCARCSRLHFTAPAVAAVISKCQLFHYFSFSLFHFFPLLCFVLLYHLSLCTHLYVERSMLFFLSCVTVASRALSPCHLWNVKHKYTYAHLFIYIWMHLISFDALSLLTVFVWYSSITLLSPNNNTSYLEPPSPSPSTSSALTSNSLAVHHF